MGREAGPERSIIHFNVADFAVAVERARDRSLRTRPLVVASGGGGRSLVYDMSEEAYRDGIRKGMLLHRALRICRTVTVLDPRPDLYRQAMRLFLREVREYSPRIEAGREDGHFYVDVTGTCRLHGPAPDVGWRIRRSVRERLGIDPIWTLAGTRLVAKVASRLVKPVGEYIVPAGDEESFLAPLPLSLLPGLAPDELDRLREFQVRTIGSLAGFSVAQLAVPFGRRAPVLRDLSRGIDAPLGEHRQAADAIRLEHHFGRDTNDRRELADCVAGLAGRAGTLLRKKDRECRRIGIWLTYADGNRVARQATSRRETVLDSQLRRLALAALDLALCRRVRVRSVGLVCDRLSPRQQQLSLFPESRPHRRQQRLQEAVDRLRDRFGPGAVRTGWNIAGGVTLDTSGDP